MPPSRYIKIKKWNLKSDIRAKNIIWIQINTQRGVSRRCEEKKLFDKLMSYNISDSKGLTGTHCEDRVYEILSTTEYSLDTTIG